MRKKFPVDFIKYVSMYVRQKFNDENMTAYFSKTDHLFIVAKDGRVIYKCYVQSSRIRQIEQLRKNHEASRSARNLREI